MILLKAETLIIPVNSLAIMNFYDNVIVMGFSYYSSIENKYCIKIITQNGNIVIINKWVFTVYTRNMYKLFQYSG